MEIWREFVLPGRSSEFCVLLENLNWAEGVWQLQEERTGSRIASYFLHSKYERPHLASFPMG